MVRHNNGIAMTNRTPLKTIGTKLVLPFLVKFGSCFPLVDIARLTQYMGMYSAEYRKFIYTCCETNKKNSPYSYFSMRL
jgi:hypothetical protein